jgi:cytochrome c peroxidase
VKIPREQREAVNRIYANMGKSIAAFVRSILPTPARFDRYVEAALKQNRTSTKTILADDEVRGLRLLIGKAKCTNRHAGPLFTNGGFHNARVPQPAGLPHDRGRAAAVAKVLADEFNCFGRYSDVKPSGCGELRFIDTDTKKYEGAFKTPTLRNVAERAPYMHAGQFGSLREVLRFYRDVKPDQRSKDLEHADLSDQELKQLEAFLKTLSAPLQFVGMEAR